jgi:hypothetical protein
MMTALALDGIFDKNKGMRQSLMHSGVHPFSLDAPAYLTSSQTIPVAYRRAGVKSISFLHSFSGIVVAATTWSFFLLIVGMLWERVFWCAHHTRLGKRLAPQVELEPTTLRLSVAQSPIS